MPTPAWTTPGWSSPPRSRRARRAHDIHTHARFDGAVRENGAWRATLADADGKRTEVLAKAIVNAAGPWVARVLDSIGTAPAKVGVRHVQGSHIVVPRVHAQEHAYILQNADNRIVFIIPYQGRYSLIGTTDVQVSEYEHPRIGNDETAYLLELVNRYLDKPLRQDDIVWTYSGVRPLYDDGESDPAAVTRDYVLKVDAGQGDTQPPVLSVYGGKLTTYRRLAESALDALRPFFPAMGPTFTARDVLPGGDVPGGDRNTYLAEITARYAALPPALVSALVKRHGTRAVTILGDAKTKADLGREFAEHLTEREVAYMVAEEWARSADDILWRRTKCGLDASAAARETLAAHLGH